MITAKFRVFPSQGSRLYRTSWSPGWPVCRTTRAGLRSPGMMISSSGDGDRKLHTIVTLAEENTTVVLYALECPTR